MMERSFKRAIASLDQVFAFVGEALADLNVPPEPAFAVELAIEEFFTNMVKYNTESRDDILLILKRDDDRLTVEMVDSGGHPFDPTSAKDPDTSLPLAERRVGGLGIHLVKTLMDDLRYQYDGGRNTITFSKNLEP
jgi:serine/threonine-protein kinase RsbW